MQTTNKVFMVRPISFTYNKETAENNSFQSNTLINNSQELALEEFNLYVNELKENGIEVITCDDTLNPHTPDSIFPNNWFSTHSDGTLVIYSMFAENRRSERKHLNKLKSCINFSKELDLSIYEKDNIFLEGTGSMVLDREHKIIYACRSIRTSEVLIDKLAKEIGYSSVVFDAVDRDDNPIYHTNVLLSVCKDFVVICLDSIKDNKQKEVLIDSFKKTNKEIIEITYDQLENFAGNVLELKNKNNDRILVISSTAKNSLTKEQLDKLESKCKLISPNISTIETLGGGSVRCMIAELFC